MRCHLGCWTVTMPPPPFCCSPSSAMPHSKQGSFLGWDPPSLCSIPNDPQPMPFPSGKGSLDKLSPFSSPPLLTLSRWNRGDWERGEERDPSVWEAEDKEQDGTILWSLLGKGKGGAGQIPRPK